MVRKLVICTVMATTLLFPAACGSGGTGTVTSSTAPAPAVVALSESANNSTVELNVGDSLIIELAGNPSTGYQWQETEGDPALLEQVGDPEFVADDPAAMGSPGRVTLRFRAVGSGRAHLQLAYQRPFEPGVPPEQSFGVEVTVR